MDFQPILNAIADECSKEKDRGIVASYIPELAKVSVEKFGMFVLDAQQNEYFVGDAHEHFSIQSVSKVLALAQAFSIVDRSLWKRVGVEPSGNPFNFLSLLEHENGIPRNPFINAGAIVVSDVLISTLKDPKQDFLAYVRGLANDQSIVYDTAVAQSEKETGSRNRATAQLLKSFGNLKNDVEEVLDFYFHQCSLSMSCEQLAKTFFVFANRGYCTQQSKYLNVNQVKRINALMLTCGFYDEAGEFAFEVGLPGKSGVGGGIAAVLPEHYSIAVWSPGLNKKGNSTLGLRALETFTTQTNLSIF